MHGWTAIPKSLIPGPVSRSAGQAVRGTVKEGGAELAEDLGLAAEALKDGAVALAADMRGALVGAVSSAKAAKERIAANRAAARRAAAERRLAKKVAAEKVAHCGALALLWTYCMRRTESDPLQPYIFHALLKCNRGSRVSA